MTCVWGRDLGNQAVFDISQAIDPKLSSREAVISNLENEIKDAHERLKEAKSGREKEFCEKFIDALNFYRSKVETDQPLPPSISYDLTSQL